jgi:hypothetical protein
LYDSLSFICRGINLENNNTIRTRAKQNGIEVTCVAGTSAVILSIDMPQE